jgi:hypothetical protein
MIEGFVIFFSIIGFLFVFFWAIGMAAEGKTPTKEHQGHLETIPVVSKISSQIVKSPSEIVNGREYTYKFLHGINAGFDATGFYCFQDLSNGSRAWFKLVDSNFVHHRFDGPAIEDADGLCYYYINGTEWPPEHYFAWMQNIKNANQLFKKAD